MIVVAGGTGTLGRFLVPKLAAGGEPVRVVARHVDTAVLPAGVEALQLDVTTSAGAAAAVRGARVVVSAITGFDAPEGVDGIDAHGNRELAEAAAAAGVEHFVLLSVTEAAADHPISLMRAKWAAEQAVRASGVDWTFVRPTVYLETWLRLIGGRIPTEGRAIVFGSGRNPINFVSAKDVAAVAERVIADPEFRGHTVEVPGPENLTLENLVEITEAATGRTGRVSHVPRPLMRVLSVVLRPINSTRAAQVATALIMDTRPMAVDANRRSIADLPMTPASEVARRVFAAPVAAGGS